jgi:transcriptional regulator with XRE-family HTH domain
VQYIRRVRLSKGFTQEKLEEIADIPQAMLSQYERDLILPSLPTAGKLSSCLEISVDSMIKLIEKREVAA